MFEHVDAYPGDPILSLMDEFNKDTRDNKINLSIGLYYDGEGKTPELATVGTAKASLNKLPASASLYLPMEGLKDYRLELQKLVFGEDCPLIAQERIATVQTIGGSGALKIGADFLHQYYPDSEVWCSDPTWENHASIFSGAGTKVHYYPYFDEKTKGVKFDEMLATFKKLPANSIILMHPCCHNPTGSDLTPAQWDEVTKVAIEHKLIPFLDIAYQGFAEGINEDAYAIRAMVKAGLTVFVSNSFSKIFGIYGERAGGLSVICENTDERDRVLGQLKAGVRRLYSSPPSNGAKIVAAVLTNSAEKAKWLAEVEEMRLRILDMRTVLVDELKKALPTKNFDHLLKQRGMFSYTGFTKEQVARLKDEFAVYLVGTGRVCMAGVNRHNVKRIVEAFAAVSQ
ncbi:MULTISPECIES: amino acid aminotransferase [Providencia]|uniref:amino acid aminotransferase n=1 Tax=Providencia TaxID=586 RepID=UPI00197D3364|nr:MULTISPECIES: amino acid aminotransferase [Providencia]MDR2226028.1 aspartate/tyrosine/aromatic aminotransferase [Providencia sp.]ELR5152725.1 aspartate/tyrosine/aromatic aminotransferase [Providencia rettgeri]MBN4866854.1 aspartate/tyrosine/aromatic aminotransferase [Providencia stuartii]MBN4876242.1 aspartate/tyrosine/aromatic aminotransferase [Providencia stuartii]MBN4880868.1 aspartate/tyrosine/aromatic aminotransferase [Providencia stuartii]